MSCVDPGTWSRKLSPASRSTRRTGFIYSRGLRSMRKFSCLRISVIYFKIKFEVLFRFLVIHKSQLFLYFPIFICNAVKSFIFFSLCVCCIWFGFDPINIKMAGPVRLKVWDFTILQKRVMTKLEKCCFVKISEIYQRTLVNI